MIGMMFVSCMCLFFLPLVPGPDNVPSGEHHQARGGYVTYIGRNSTLQVTRRGAAKESATLFQPPPLERVRWPSDLRCCLLQALTTQPPPPQRKSARFLPIMEQRNVARTLPKDIRSFHDFQSIHKEIYGY